MITVINAGFGNYRSVANMLNYLGLDAEIKSTPKKLSATTHLILPGIGSFDSGMKLLHNSGWAEAICEMRDSVKILGICLGMQLLTKSSEEGNLAGLGIIDAECRKFDNSYSKVPHIGWNSVEVTRHNNLLPKVDPTNHFYHSHSFYVHSEDKEIAIAYTKNEIKFISAFQKNNVFGVQFHPEKSHKFGLEFFERFAKLK
jgi:glutamine amidotransferase